MQPRSAIQDPHDVPGTKGHEINVPAFAPDTVRT